MQVEKRLAKLIGPRCKTKDTHDFPELLDEDGRCPTCAIYELFDELLIKLDPVVYAKGLHIGYCDRCDRLTARVNGGCNNEH